MSNLFESCLAQKLSRTVASLLIGFALACICVSPAAAQKEKKKKPEPPSDSDTSKVLSAMTDEQQIDYTLSDMLGAWQLGDIDKLRQDYGDDVAIVNGAWAPPVIGWNNFLAVYQQQRARMQQVRMDRTNTYIKVNGNVGWACYQWDFEAVVDGQQMLSQGQTTVVLEKRNNRWVIVLNHTSLAQRVPASAPPNATPTTQQPVKPS